MWVDYLTFGILGFFGPIGFYFHSKEKKLDKIEDKYPDFLRDLAEFWRGGLSMTTAVDTLSQGEYGALDDEVQKMATQLSWGVAFTDVLNMFKERVKSTPLFMLSIPVINYFTRKYKTPTQTIYNLSDGCRFDQTVPTLIKDVVLPQKQDKNLLRKEMRSYFDNLSTIQLAQNEIDGLYCRIGQIKDYYTMLEKFTTAPHSDALQFKLNLIAMVSGMCNHECIFELRDLMTIYYMNTTPYADDFFNTQELEKRKKFTKKFHSIFAKNVRKIIATYEKDLYALKVLEKEDSQAQKA